MANKSISMSKIRHLLQLYIQGRSKKLISEQTGIARNTLKKYIKEFIDSGLSIEVLNALSDKELEDLFVKPEAKPINTRLATLFSLFPKYERELKKKGVTRIHVWSNYKEAHPDGVGRSQFNHYYTLWKKQASPTMRMEHKAGDKMYVDFVGDRLQIVDEQTGEIKNVEVFVAVLGASQLTYAEAVMTQQKEDFITACENAMHYYGGVPLAIVPDNLKAAVTKSSKYEPVINETFADFASHYNTAVLPARAFKPRDKALVENAVRILYNRMYAHIKKQSYTSIEALNETLWQELDKHNNTNFTSRDYSRRKQFEDVEKAALLPLPLMRYELRRQSSATVMKNGHVHLSVDRHYYSVPYSFIGRKVTLKYNRTTIEIYSNYERIAIHARDRTAYNYTTDAEHMASTHRYVSEWTPDRFLSWAESVDKDVKQYLLEIFHHKKHPEQAYKSCAGILNFEKKVGRERLINACRRGLDFGMYSYKAIEKILHTGLDKDYERIQEEEESTMPTHDNIRGESYYQ
jgi:transposase